MASLQSQLPGGVGGLDLDWKVTEQLGGQIHEFEDKSGGIGRDGQSAQMKIHYDVEEPPAKGGEPDFVMDKVKEKLDHCSEAGQEGKARMTEEVARDTENVKICFAEDNGVEPMEGKVGEEAKVKPEVGHASRDAKPAFFTRIKNKLWRSRSDVRSHVTKPADFSAVTRKEGRTSGCDSGSRTGSLPGTEGETAGKIFICSGAEEAHSTGSMKPESSEPHEEHVPSRDETVLSSELGTGYEEESEDSGVEGEDLAGHHTPPSTEDLLASKDVIPTAEEVKAPGLVERMKEEAQAVAATIQEKLNLKDDSRESYIESEGKGAGLISRLARRIGLANGGPSQKN